MEDRKLLDSKIKQINKHLTNQRLTIDEVKDEQIGFYYELKWDRDTSVGEYEELIFSGDAFEIQISLISVEYGIRIEKNSR